MKLINADELIATHEKHVILPDLEYGNYQQVSFVLLDDIKRFPELQAGIERRGFWIENYCSVCAEKSEKQYHYCPNCGAKMS